MATQVITQRADIAAGRAQSAAIARPRRAVRRASTAGSTERRHYRNTVAKLDALADEMLADIGVLRGDIQAIARRLARQARAGR